MDITELLQRASEGIEPDVASLVDGGLRRGRRRAVVVRAATGLSALGLAAGVAVLVVALLPDGARSSGSAGGPGSVTPPAKSLTKPAATHTTVATTPQALLQRAIDSLPAPGRTSHYAGNFSDTYAGTTFVYDDGRGAAGISLGLFSDPAANAIQACAAGSPGCRVLADGSHALIAQGKQYQDGRTPNSTEWSVTLVRPDGVAVDVYEYNAPQAKGAQPTRDRPPFPIDVLVAWADGPQWVTRITALEAKTTAHLFEPVDLSAPPSGSVRRSKVVERRNCALAKRIHKQPPAYCITLR